jgi:hypothetical protein
MKVEKFQNLSIFLATYWNFSQKSGDLKTFFSKSDELEPFFPWKIHGSKSYFSLGAC